MSKLGNDDLFDGMMSAATKPAEKEEKVRKVGKKTGKIQKKEENDNLKRCTFWADRTQWDWVQNYAYTTRQSIMDTMYSIIEEFQEKNKEIELKSKPIRRGRRGNK